jgi:hypothetical protein
VLIGEYEAPHHEVRLSLKCFREPATREVAKRPRKRAR